MYPKEYINKSDPEYQVFVEHTLKVLLEMQTNTIPHLERAPEEVLVEVEKGEEGAPHYPRREREVVMMSLTTKPHQGPYIPLPSQIC